MPRSDRRTFLASSGAAILAGMAGCTGGDGTPTIGLNYVVPVENLGSLMEIDEIQAELDNIGDEYEVEIQSDPGTPDSINAMAAGETDMVLVTTVSYASAIANEAVPGGFTAIAMDFWDAHPDRFGFEVYSNLDQTDVENPEDMEGSQLGISAVGTGVHAVYVSMLNDVGLGRDDVEFIELEFPATTEALNDGRFDTGMYPAFFGPQARSEDFNLVFRSQDTWTDGQYPFAWYVASNNSLEEKGEAFDALGEDYIQLVDYVFDNRDEVVSLAAEHFELPESLIDAFYLTEDFDYYRQDSTVDVDALNNHMSSLVELDFLEENRDYSEFVNNEFVS